MSKTLALRRFSLILEKVTTDRFPSFGAIKSFLERHGFEFSGRTLQRDLSRMEHLFQIKISYDHQKRGYFFDQDQSINLDIFLRFLQVSSEGELMTEALADGRQVMRHLSFGTAEEPSGTCWLRPLLDAIRQRHLVSFTFRDFSEAQPRPIARLMPLLLREYLGRWHLVGTFVRRGPLQAFGLDRITDLTVEPVQFTRDPDTNPATLFAKAIGVGQAEGEPQRVLLAFRRAAGESVKTLPWHRSQKVVQEVGDRCLIELQVVPNLELQQRILMFGAAVQVLEPAWLAREIATTHREAADQYAARPALAAG
ncbi:MAG: WYL domain-containing protein [Candidatus Riflebacteria bacterium]|nr:WYL domain-containing protein [Candidatus Riflebacteria bacterium]